jgi:hypothetical protein
MLQIRRISALILGIFTAVIAVVRGTVEFIGLASVTDDLAKWLVWINSLTSWWSGNMFYYFIVTALVLLILLVIWPNFPSRIIGEIQNYRSHKKSKIPQTVPVLEIVQKCQSDGWPLQPFDRDQKQAAYQLAGAIQEACLNNDLLLFGRPIAPDDVLYAKGPDTLEAIPTGHIQRYMIDHDSLNTDAENVNVQTRPLGEVKSTSGYYDLRVGKKNLSKFLKSLNSFESSTSSKPVISSDAPVLLPCDEQDLIPIRVSVVGKQHADGTDVKLRFRFRNRSQYNLRLKGRGYDFEIDGKKQATGKSSSGLSSPMKPSTEQIIDSGLVRLYKPKTQIDAWFEVGIAYGGAEEDTLEATMWTKYIVTINDLDNKSGDFEIKDVKNHQEVLRYEKEVLD